ncbi:MAG: hypothetical protein WC850_01885 [Candidatus Gracilibacteria bacterium]
MNTTKRYFKGIQKESSICKAFQKYIENKRDCKSFLKTRDDKQAPIDFMGRFYDKVTGETIVEVAVEVRSLELSIEYIEKGLGFIMFPISKLNELMKFRRMKKEVYIVYLLKDKVYFLLWDYYLTHNFELGFYKKGPFIKLPIRNLIECGEM